MCARRHRVRSTTESAANRQHRRLQNNMAMWETSAITHAASADDEHAQASQGRAQRMGCRVGYSTVLPSHRAQIPPRVPSGTLLRHHMPKRASPRAARSSPLPHTRQSFVSWPLITTPFAGCSGAGRLRGTRQGSAACAQRVDACQTNVGWTGLRQRVPVLESLGGDKRSLKAWRRPWGVAIKQRGVGGRVTHRSLTSAERPCSRTGTTVESRYVRIGAVCRFILFCTPIAAFSAPLACVWQAEGTHLREHNVGGAGRPSSMGAYLPLVICACAGLRRLQLLGILHCWLRLHDGCGFGDRGAHNIRATEASSDRRWRDKSVLESRSSAPVSCEGWVGASCWAGEGRHVPTLGCRQLVRAGYDPHTCPYALHAP